MYISSMTAFSSVSEKLRISVSFTSLSISTNVSAARSFGSSRKIAGIIRSGMSLSMAAMSAGYSVCIRSRSEAYFFSSVSLRKVSSRISVLSFMVTPPIVQIRWNGLSRGERRPSDRSRTRQNPQRQRRAALLRGKGDQRRTGELSYVICVCAISTTASVHLLHPFI